LNSKVECGVKPLNDSELQPYSRLVLQSFDVKMTLLNENDESAARQPSPALPADTSDAAYAYFGMTE
jgi:hypothetical protein